MNDSIKLHWDLSPLSSSDPDLKFVKKREFVRAKSYGFINKWRMRVDYLSDPKVLKEALDDYEDWQRLCGTDGDEGYYFSLRKAQDQNNSDIKARLTKITDFSTKILNDIQFFELNLSKVSPEKQNEFLKHPNLLIYRHFLERLFVKARYVLSESEEKVVNLYSTPAFSNWVTMLSGFISKEKRVVLTEEEKEEEKASYEILSLIDSKKKQVRDKAAEAFNDILLKYVEVAENEINSVLQVKKISDDLRGFDRPDKARHLSDDIESEVVDSLLLTVSRRFDISQKYYDLKAKLLGVAKLEYHERNVEYGEISKKYPYENAVDLVGETFKALDHDFYEIFQKFLTNGNFDVYPKAGKSGGAFCAGRLLTQPTYILLNHTDKLNDVLTIAHEVGHGINNELMKKVRHALDFDTPLSTAEVASTFMEDFVLEEIISQATEEERLAIMMMRLNSDVSTIMRQVACYRFEQELHLTYREKGYLSKEEIGAIFQKHMNSYMGDAVLQSKGSEKWWVYWKHIRNPFYVYSYASGLLISKSLQNAVKKDRRFLSKVKEFLSAGTSSSPRNIFLNLGIDITDKDFWNAGLNELQSLLDQTQVLARKLKKL